MHIKAKLYPYPVLAEFNNDYVNNKFNINTSIELTPNEIIVKFDSILDNEEMITLIKNNQASFLMHIECSLTSFREIVFITDNMREYRIPADKIEGLLNFCPFIVATTDILGYSSKNLNKDYDGVLFDLEKGNILAIGKEVQTRIEKENDDLANVPSIFSVTEIKDIEKKDIIIDNTGNKIHIQLPSDSFMEFKLAMANPSSMAVLHSMIIIPALMKCFEDIKSKPEEFYLFEDRRWFRVIKKALKRHNIEITEDTLLSIDSFVYAQKLMDNTTIRAILSINDIAYKGDLQDD